MSDTTPEPEPNEPDSPAPDDGLNPAPKDNENGSGYAVYDRELARYVGGVHQDKPSARTAKELAGGHKYAIVKV